MFSIGRSEISCSVFWVFSQIGRSVMLGIQKLGVRSLGVVFGFVGNFLYTSSGPKTITHCYFIFGGGLSFFCGKSHNEGHFKGGSMKILTFRGGLDFFGPKMAKVMAFPATKRLSHPNIKQL